MEPLFATENVHSQYFESGLSLKALVLFQNTIDQHVINGRKRATPTGGTYQFSVRSRYRRGFELLLNTFPVCFVSVVGFTLHSAIVEE